MDLYISKIFSIEEFNKDNTIYNYLEIIFLEKNIKNKKNNLNFEKFKINFDKELFTFILNNFITKSCLKPFEKKFIKYFYEDKELFYSKNDNKYNVHLKNLINLSNKKNFLYIKYVQKDLPYINFPSTIDINDTILENKIIFKLTNRLYLNFSIYTHKNNNNNIYYKIYFNFNNNTNNNIDYKLNYNLLNKYALILLDILNDYENQNISSESLSISG